MQVRDIPLDKLIKAPFIFNGSIFKFEGQNYLAYRANWSRSKCKLYVTKTDKNWYPLAEGWQIKIPILGNLFEDPRFIEINKKPYLAVSQIDITTHCQYQGLVELNEKLQFQSYTKIDYGDNWSLVERQNKNRKENEHYINFNTPITFEKNWCFLANEDQPTFIYRTQPVAILAQFNNLFQLEKEQSDAKDFNWPFGEIRGGTPAIKVKNIYYHFFHSSTHADPYSQTESNQIGRIYYMGCYTFKRNDDSFELLSQTRIPLEMGDYTDRVELWRNAAVFPCGVYFENGEFQISYGWNDYKLKLLSISLEELNSLLTPLKIPIYLENTILQKR